VGLTPAEARAGALGEACERYAFSISPPQIDGVQTIHATLTREQILSLPLFLSDQASDVVQVEDTLKREKAWVTLCSWPKAACGSQHGLIVPRSILFADCSNPALPASSSGMAAGPTLDFSLYRAICELVERDAFMCAWLHRYSGARIEETCVLPPMIVNWINRLRECNVDFRIHDISSDITPFRVFLGYVLRLRNGRPVSAAFGAGCALDFREAALRAFLESALSWRGAEELLTLRGKMLEPRRQRFKPTSFSDHVYLYQHEGSMPSIAHLLRQQAVPREYASVTKRRDVLLLDMAVRSLGRHGFKVFFLNVTPPEFARSTIVVVRVIVPMLVPLSWAEYRPLSTSRLLRPKWIPTRVRRVALNPDVHPFP
jgi:ribosomal protein S12 methylthiotransferase accessory factor